MKLYMKAVAAVAILLCAQTSWAQDENPAYEHLEQLQPLIGTWEAEIDTGQFVGRTRITYEWILRDRFIRENQRFQPQGESEFAEPFAAGVFGWDPNEQSLIHTTFFGFGSGFQAMRQVSRSGDTWKTGKFIHGIGTRQGIEKRMTTWSIEDDGSLVVTITGIVGRGGNARPDRTVRYKRTN